MDPQSADQIKSNEEEEEEQEDDDEEHEQGGPSVLRLMVDKHEAIEQTVSLIKQELAHEIIPELVAEQAIGEPGCSSAGACGASSSTTTESERKFDGLTSLLDDSKIKSAIKDVAGNDTHELLDRALVALKSSQSMDGKNKVFADGIKKLHANLTRSDKSKLQKDPLFSLAINLVGLRPNNNKHN